MSTENKNPIQQLLTIGITACYKSNIFKFKQLFKSLFSNFSFELPKDVAINSIETKQYLDKLINEFNDETINKFDYIYNLSKDIIHWLHNHNYQTYIELLIVIDNDCQLNNTNVEKLIDEINKINQVIKKYVMVRYIVTSKNVKISCARNIIINEAKGKYLIFCDDDDLKMNINQILNILIENDFETSSESYSYMSHYVHKNSYENIKHTIVPHISNIGVWNGIYLTNFLKENQIYFVPNLNMEDVIWRSNLNYYLSNKNSKCKQINKIGYIYMDASNRSLNQINNRFLDEIDSNNISLLNSTNEIYYKSLNKILSQQLQYDFKITDWRLFGITSSISFFKQHNIIYQWLINNIDSLPNGYDKRMLELTNILNQEPVFSNQELYNISLFSILTEEDKKKAFWVFSKYVTLPDLYLFAKYLDQNIILDIMNDIWKNNFNYNVYYKKIAKNDYFEQFVYKFLHFIYMQNQNPLYTKYINIELIEKIKNEYLREIENIPINECLNFIHDRMCKSKTSVSNIENLFCNQIVKFENLSKTIASLIENKEEFKSDKEEILKLTNEFIKQNRIETTEIRKYDNNYKGPMNVFQFYIFSLPLMNKLVKEIKIINYDDFINCQYEIKCCENYYTLRNVSIDINELSKLTKYYNEDELLILKNVHNYSLKKIKQLLTNKIKSKYLIKFNYDQLIYLHNHGIDLKIFNQIENYYELKLIVELIEKIITKNEELIETINQIKDIQITDLTKILSLLKLGFNTDSIQLYLSKDEQIEYNYNYKKFNQLNSKFSFYFKIESYNLMKLYSEEFIDIKFIQKMIESKHTLKHKFIIEYLELFKPIIYIISIFEELNLDINQYHNQITNINKLRFELTTNLK